MDVNDFQARLNSELNKSIFYDSNDDREKRAYIFNHFMFNVPPGEATAPGMRHGTQEDNQRIYKCLLDRGFVVKKIQDAYKSKIMDTLHKASELKKSEVSCIVVVIMSHGDKDIIFARDQSYPITVLFNPFMREACDLDGIPKLYFVQACRGDKLDDGLMEIDSPETGYSIPYEIPPVPDMLCMFSTAKEHLSWRNRTNGSWFIQSLCRNLEIHKEKNLLHLLTLVNNEVATQYASKTYNPNDKNSLTTHDKKQMTHVESTLTKLLIF